MHSRALRWAVLLFQSLWLNAIVPGHQRGAVALPGERCETCQERSVAVAPCCHSHGASARAQRSTTPIRGGDPASHCAICYFAAQLCVPPVIDFTPPALGLVELLEIPCGQTPPRIDFFLPYDGRAPPVGAPHIV